MANPLQAVCLRCMRRLSIWGPSQMAQPLSQSCCDVCHRGPLLPAREAPNLPIRVAIGGLLKRLNPETGKARIKYTPSGKGASH